MAYTIEPAVQGARNVAQAKVDQANAQFEKLKADYAASPEVQLQNDREYLKKLQNDPAHLDRKIAGSRAAANEEATTEARIRMAETTAAQSEAQRVDAIIRGDVLAGAETTIGDQIPRRDLATAVGDIVEHGVRPELIENFLKTGRSGGPDTREAEIAAAREWRRRLDADPEAQRRLLAGDPELMRQLTAYSIYAPALGEQ
jgi:aminopeptidase N